MRFFFFLIFTLNIFCFSYFFSILYSLHFYLTNNKLFISVWLPHLFLCSMCCYVSSAIFFACLPTINIRMERTFHQMEPSQKQKIRMNWNLHSNGLGGLWLINRITPTKLWVVFTDKSRKFSLFFYSFQIFNKQTIVASNKYQFLLCAPLKANKNKEKKFGARFPWWFKCWIWLFLFQRAVHITFSAFINSKFEWMCVCVWEFHMQLLQLHSKRFRINRIWYSTVPPDKCYTYFSNVFMQNEHTQTPAERKIIQKTKIKQCQHSNMLWLRL